MKDLEKFQRKYLGTISCALTYSVGTLASRAQVSDDTTLRVVGVNPDGDPLPKMHHSLLEIIKSLRTLPQWAPPSYKASESATTWSSEVYSTPQAPAAPSG